MEGRKDREKFELSGGGVLVMIALPHVGGFSFSERRVAFLVYLVPRCICPGH